MPSWLNFKSDLQHRGLQFHQNWFMWLSTTWYFGITGLPAFYFSYSFTLTQHQQHKSMSPLLWVPAEPTCSTAMSLTAILCSLWMALLSSVVLTAARRLMQSTKFLRGGCAQLNRSNACSLSQFFLMFQVVPVVTCSIAVLHWEELGSVFSTLSHQADSREVSPSPSSPASASPEALTSPCELWPTWGSFSGAIQVPLHSNPTLQHFDSSPQFSIITELPRVPCVPLFRLSIDTQHSTVLVPPCMIQAFQVITDLPADLHPACCYTRAQASSLCLPEALQDAPCPCMASAQFPHTVWLELLPLQSICRDPVPHFWCYAACSSPHLFLKCPNKTWNTWLQIQKRHPSSSPSSARNEWTDLRKQYLGVWHLLRPDTLFSY